MREFLVAGPMPCILVMSVFFLIRFLMYLLPAKSKGTFLFWTSWHYRKRWLVVVTAILIGIYVAWGFSVCTAYITGSASEQLIERGLLCLPILWGALVFFPERIYTNGVQRMTAFDMWSEIARIENLGDNTYQVFTRAGVKYRLYLHEGDRLPDAGTPVNTVLYEN